MADLFTAKLPATLVRRYIGRVVDISSGGCLIEIAAPVPIGAIGRLEAVIDGRVHSEAVRVARIETMPTRTGGTQIGLEFLLVSPASVGSIRGAMHRLTAGADAIVRFTN
jgi:hypothetical protein